MATYRDLITSALRLINVVSEAETPTAYQAETALAALEELIDQFNASQIMIYTQDIVLHTLTNSATFTIGAGGDVDVPSRPFKLDAAFLRMNTASTPIDIPMSVLSASEWMGVRSKSVQSTYPRYIYINGDWPLATAHLWPVPTGVGDTSIGLLLNHTLTTGLTLDDEETLPPAYRQALRFGLAELLAPEYGREAPPTVIAKADSSKRLLMQTNTDIDRLSYDISGVTGGRYWIVADDRI